MKLRLVIVAAALLAALPSYSQKEALKAISLKKTDEYMKYLSSDQLEGRRTGSDGNNTAAGPLEHQVHLLTCLRSPVE